MKILNILVIHEEIPEKTTVALVPMTEEEYIKLSQAHGGVIGETNLADAIIDAISAIGWALDSNDAHLQYAETPLQKEYFGKWIDYVVTSWPEATTVHGMIRCGFIM